MRYVRTRYEREQRELAYRFYVTNALRIITENTAKMGGGQYMKYRFCDIVTPPTEDDRSGDEIAENIKEKLKRIGGGE